MPRVGKTGLPLIGVAGGMGPLASAALLDTIYKLDPPAVEQRAPRVLLWSDPSIVDRTEASGSGQTGSLLAALERSVSGLLEAGASTVVIACVTAHSVVGLLPPELAARCVSLVNVIFDELARRPLRHLLLCTSGSRTTGVFTDHERWSALGQRLICPDEADQAELHRRLYLLKRDRGLAEIIEFIKDLLARYQVSAFVAGCTELHMVTKAISAANLSSVMPSIDPMALIARCIREGTL
jgi:aspartate racemase